MKPLLMVVAALGAGGVISMLSTRQPHPPKISDASLVDLFAPPGVTPSPTSSVAPRPPPHQQPRSNLSPSPSTPLPPSHWECEWGTPPETGRCTSLSHQQEAFSAFSAFVGRSVGKVASQNRSQDVVCQRECAAVFRMNDPVDMFAKAVEGNGKETRIFMIGDSTVRKLFEKITGELPKRVTGKDKRTDIHWSYVLEREFALKSRLRLAFAWSTNPVLPKRTVEDVLETIRAKPDITIYSTGLWALWKPTYERALMLACTFREDAQVALTRLSGLTKKLYVLSADSICSRKLKRDYFKEMPDRVSICKSKDLCKKTWSMESKNSYLAPSRLWTKEHGEPDQDPTPPQCSQCRTICEHSTFNERGSRYIANELQNVFQRVKANNSHYVDMTTVTRNAGCDFCSDGVHHEHIVLDTKLSLLVHHIFINSDVKAAAGKALYKW